MENDPKIALIDLYKTYTGKEPTACIPLKAQASKRKYFRLSGPISCIGVVGNVSAENSAFKHLSHILCESDIKVPCVYIENPTALAYLQEDLGDISLYDLIIREGFSDNVIDLCRQSLYRLIDFQLIDRQPLDTGVLFPVACMDKQSIMWDLNYFKYCFLKAIDIEIDEPRLEQEFEIITKAISQSSPKALIHRDFQSRNIMLTADGPYFIDFQGARLGPALYDAISFLWQARINMPEELRFKLLSEYVSLLSKRTGIDSEQIQSSIWDIIIFRMLQVLGAYGYRGLIQGKDKFINSIPGAIASLVDALNNSHLALPYLLSITDDISSRYEDCTDSAPSTLTVDVISFSYKKGYPVDDTGNGGGFVFDCRAIHNPGRYAEYVDLTGNDEAVKNFLETNSEINDFIRECAKLVDRNVEVYMRRGFTHLSVAFGCTGGRHRSVYSANALAAHLAGKYNIRVILTHREQGTQTILNPDYKKSKK